MSNTDIGYPISMFHLGGVRFGRRGWLRPWVLGMLQRAPKNGAELIDEIERTSWGWRPSPGSIYPLLEELAKDGLIHRRPDGRYEVTERGRESMSMPWEIFGAHPTSVEGMVAEMGSTVAYLEDLRTSDPSRLARQSEAIRALAERLARLA